MGDIQLRVMMRLRYVLCALTFGLPCWAEADERLERAREGCATEISMFCAENKDTLNCLKSQGAGLTARCRRALSEEDQPPMAQAADARLAAEPSAATIPQGVTGVAGVGNVWFKDDYAGPRPGLYPKFRDALSAEAPSALQAVAKLMGQSNYGSAFPRPLVLRVEYDPTQRNGLGWLDPTGNRSEGQRVNFNLAYWEDCPSKAILRSVVTHEMTHAALHDFVGDAGTAHIPQWFDEGLGMLAGGEPFATLILDSAYYRHGSGYPAALSCRLENDGFQGLGLLNDCYPYYLLAVRHIAESSPEALPGVISDLGSGIALQKSIPARLGVSWIAFEAAVEARVRRTFRWMSPLSRLTGRGWWRQVRWCRG